ncbi:hypothetical protein HDZ31DRAFT_34298, partial [Schizophyllum fasciatum]
QRKPMRVQSDDESEEESAVPAKRTRVEEEPIPSEDDLIDIETPEAPSRLRRQFSTSKRPSKPPAKPSTRKRKRAAASDAESEDEFFNDAVESDDAFDEPPPEASDNGDDDFVVDDAPKRGKGKAAPGRSKARSRAAEKEDTKEIKMKDERQQKPPPAKRARPADDDADAPAPAAPEPVPSVVSVKGLPRIKKNKSSASTAPGTPSTPATAKPVAASKPAAKAALDLTKELGIQPTSRKVAAVTQPASDLDLNNKDSWASLFKARTGPPRAGVKNDDGRKELAKKREEERARRMENLRITFDLQAQTDKIIRFEERLRSQHSGVLYPNFLAAKWRDVYEREKKQAQLASAGGTPRQSQSARTPQHSQSARTPQHSQSARTPQLSQSAPTPQHAQSVQTPQHSQHVLTPQYPQDNRPPVGAT